MPSYTKASPDAQPVLVHQTKMEPPKVPAPSAPVSKPADARKPAPQATSPAEPKPQEG